MGGTHVHYFPHKVQMKDVISSTHECWKIFVWNTARFMHGRLKTQKTKPTEPLAAKSENVFMLCDIKTTCIVILWFSFLSCYMEKWENYTWLCLDSQSFHRLSSRLNENVKNFFLTAEYFTILIIEPVLRCSLSHWCTDWEILIIFAMLSILFFNANFCC